MYIRIFLHSTNLYRKRSDSVCKVLECCVSGQGPMCSSCKEIGSSTIQLTCSVVYADSTFDPIAAIFTIYVDGNAMASDTPQRTINADGYTWISTSTFTTTYSRPSTYQCGQTFGQPTEVQDSTVATNAPTFSQIHVCSFPAPGEFKANYIVITTVPCSVFVVNQ